jgi:hypothetical protein
MWRFLSIGLLVTAALNAAEPSGTSRKELIDMVRAGLQAHTPDKALSKSLHKIALSERLDLRTIEELESEGAGTETVAALEWIFEQSAEQPAPTAIPPFTIPARPSIEEQKEFFHRVNVAAIHYTASLPNFICNEVIHRYQMKQAPLNRTGRGAFTPTLGTGIWQPKDILTVKLSYFENREKYELTLVNGRKTRASYESSGGAISEGDFGSIMLEIFSPDTGTKFMWDHWTHLRKRLTRVYSYRTLREKSHYRIGVGERPEERRMITAGRRGYVYADDATGMVMRITGEAEGIPRGFPVIAQSTIIDYEYGDVGGKSYLLPLRVENRMKTWQVSFKNIMEFQDYRKFTGESSISFDVPDSETTPAPATPEKN